MTRRSQPEGRPQHDTDNNSTTDVQVPNDEVGHWVGRIRPHLESAAESIIAAGREFIAAKEALPHGGFGQVADDLGVDQSTVRRFMAIASNGALNRAHAHGLPTTWTVLYELSKVEPDALEEAIERGIIGPATTRAEAKELRQIETHSGADSTDENPNRRDPSSKAGKRRYDRFERGWASIVAMGDVAPRIEFPDDITGERLERCVTELSGCINGMNRLRQQIREMPALATRESRPTRDRLHQDDKGSRQGRQSRPGASKPVPMGTRRGVR